MASRRDQLHAYRFLSRRNAGALLSGESEQADASLRRVSATTMGSLIVALLAVAAIGLYGLVRPGSSTSWRDGKHLIVESETGTRYVYLDQVLHPVLNYASALLILRGGGAPVSVGRASLAATAHGQPIGIPGAPDEVPSPSALLTADVSVCTSLASDSSGGQRPIVEAAIGGAAPGTPVPAGSGVLVSAGDGREYLVWNGTRLRLGGAYAATALGYAATPPQPVADAWLTAMPAGPDLAAITVAGLGDAGPRIGGTTTRIGQVFTLGGDAPSYVVFADGLAPLTPLQEQLLAAQPEYGQALGSSALPRPLTAAVVAAAPVSRTSLVGLAGLPATAPKLIDTRTAPLRLCGHYADPGAATPPVLTTAPAPARTVPAGVSVDSLGGAVADAVQLASGHGALVRAQPSPGVSTGTLYLITDLGVKYPVAATNVLTDLGLGSASPMPMPSGLLQLFPTGPTLDEAAAASTQPVRPDPPSR